MALNFFLKNQAKIKICFCFFKPCSIQLFQRSVMCTKHTDLLKFALPLSDDVFNKVDLICDKLCHMKDVDLEIRHSTMPLILMARELNVDDWWCNRFFSMVAELPLKIHSRWYIFERFISALRRKI